MSIKYLRNNLTYESCIKHEYQKNSCTYDIIFRQNLLTTLFIYIFIFF